MLTNKEINLFTFLYFSSLFYLVFLVHVIACISSTLSSTTAIIQKFGNPENLFPPEKHVSFTCFSRDVIQTWKLTCEPTPELEPQRTLTSNNCMCKHVELLLLLLYVN